MFVLVAACILVLSACGSSAGDSAPASEATTVPLVASSSTVTTTTVAPTTSAITTTVPSTTTSIPSEEAGPDYVVTGPEGVFRVVDGDAARVLDRDDVWWAADDGMGGVVYAPAAIPPSTIEWIPTGSTAPEVIVENAVGGLGYVTLLEGHPHVVTVVEFAPETSGSEPSVATVIYDLVSGTEKVVGSYPSSGETWMHPQSMGGRRGVEADWSNPPPGARLMFTDRSGIEIEVVTNPWPEFCLGCGLWPYLSPDGTKLALVEFLPEPADLAVADWDSFLEMGKVEQWDRWFSARQTTPVTLRVVDLETGDTLHSHLLPSILGTSRLLTLPRNLGAILDFDGRYVVLCSDPCALPSDHLLIDSHTGEQLPINWGVSELGSEYRTLRLFLPVPAANEISLRADGLGVATFGDPVEEVIEILAGMLGLPDVDEQLGPPIDPHQWGLSAANYLRRVEWTDLRLHAVFSDSDRYYRADGVPHLIGYSCGSPVCATPEGLSVGHTVDDLQRIFGPLVLPEEPNECGYVWNMEIEQDPTPDEWQTGAREVGFDGDPSEPGTQVSWIGSGARSEC